MRNAKSIVTAAVVLILATYPILAQSAGQELPADKTKACTKSCGFPDLTAEQASKIQKLKLEFEKEMLPLRQKMQALSLDFRTLMAEKADLSKLGVKIDEMSKVRAEMKKKSLAHHQQIRGLLTEEQKASFDKKGCGMGFGCGTRSHGFDCGESGCKGHGKGKMKHGGHGEGGCRSMKDKR
ncbi:MAG: Spy/CpxP family protein refolding chaperone [Candidatus Aminicenantales bacterium]